jgi:hypothetical protein
MSKKEVVMGNPMKYIKDLEAAGFDRQQAEAQVQMVLDAVEGELVTKSDFALFQERLDSRFTRVQEQFQLQIKDSEFRIVTRLGFLIVSTTTIAVAVLTWLIKL